MNNPSPSQPQLSFTRKLAYGFGATAFGVKNNGIDYFLLMFYSLVVGMDPALVGLALAIALVFDAISDPLVGYLSDNLHSRWGRRHPFMYFSALPLGIAYLMLWNPPDWSDTQLFVYLTMLCILVRTLITLYETPSAALAAELTEDYDQRTKLIGLRNFFGWIGGNFMSVLMFGVLLVATVEYPDGRLNPESYSIYGVIAALIIFAAIVVSSLGTHAQIPHLKAPPAKRRITLGRMFTEIFQSLAERSAISLILSSVFAAVATGVGAALTFTMLTYFWELTSQQILIWTTPIFISAFVGMALAPWVSKRLGKRNGAIVLGILAFGLAPLPVVGRLLGFMPENGDPAVFWILTLTSAVDYSLIIAMQILAGSMIADLVEQSELRTKRRSEGVFFAAITLTRKSVQGLGVFLAGVILSLVQFPQQALPGEIGEATLRELGGWYAGSLYLLWAATLVMLTLYSISRESHAANLERLRQDAGGTAAT